MESFLFALNAVVPVMSLVILGYVLKKTGLISQSFAKAAGKLVFYVFLPVMLFSNVYKIPAPGDIDLSYILFTVVFLILTFLTALPLVCLISKKNEQRGPLLQSAFRSNFSHVGIPLAMSMFGDEGVAMASLISAVLVPLVNVLAVISLSVFRRGGGKLSAGDVIKNIVKNPLIRAVFLGLVLLVLREGLSAKGLSLDLMKIEFIAKPFSYLSAMATPLALIALGAQFEFSTVSGMKKEIFAGVLLRTVIVPILAIGAALLLGIFNGAHFATFVAVFATPAAISSVPMAQEMDADSVLAGQLVVWTTLTSAFTVFLFTYVLKILGIF